MVFLLAPHCVSPRPTASSPEARPTTTPSRVLVANDPCGGKARCEVIRRRPSEGLGEVVDVAIRKNADAGDDECTFREYWFFRTGEKKPKLLAVDCDVQRSAEGPGVAETHLSDGKFSVTYVDFQASDHCERYEATVTLVPFSVFSQTRWEGESNAQGCKTKRRLKKLAPLGSGEQGQSVLRLHVEWVDVYGDRSR
jgi:hypothetical protein